MAVNEILIQAMILPLSSLEQERLLVLGVYSGPGEQILPGVLIFNLPIDSRFSLHHQVGMHLGS